MTDDAGEVGEAVSLPEVPFRSSQQLIVVGLVLGSMSVLTIGHVSARFFYYRDSPEGMVAYLAAGLASSVVLVGSIAMVRRTWFKLAMAGVLISFVPFLGPCCGFSIPIATWGFVLLMNPDVQAEFQRRQGHEF